MLILSRREGQSLVITLPDGRTVTVTVTGIQPWNGKVRLGTTAPPDVRGGPRGGGEDA